ncbi:Hypothetical_protein [Hexamita inflata]|uniref:Hypothetical_protein n=1 Tax=Hexamita inflata TaxID=28002 RepID=A0AA86TFN3_9EUKA|nr:Hypothetical protein HINF_LOCUS4020 [Hexamita inflata]
MKIITLALSIRLVASILVIISFDMWFVNQIYDLFIRSMDTSWYFHISMTSKVLIIVYGILFIVAAILLTHAGFSPCSCCCVFKSPCCLRVAQQNSFKTNRKFISPLQLVIRTITVFLTATCGIWFALAFMYSNLTFVLVVGALWNLSFLFQIIFKTLIDRQVVIAAYKDNILGIMSQGKQSEGYI